MSRGSDLLTETKRDRWVQRPVPPSHSAIPFLGRASTPLSCLKIRVRLLATGSMMESVYVLGYLLNFTSPTYLQR